MTVALAETNAPEPWHRLPNESPKAFAAFNLYRNLPPPRTVRSAAELHAETVPRRGTHTSTVYTQFKDWSRKYDWHSRVDAFDLMLDRQRILAMETERQRIDREHMQEGRFIRRAALTRLAGGKDEKGKTLKGVDWGEVDADLALSAYRLGRDTERQAAGLAIGGQLGMTSVAHAREVINQVIEAAMAEIPEERKQVFAQKVQQIAEANS